MVRELLYTCESKKTMSRDTGLAVGFGLTSHIRVARAMIWYRPFDGVISAMLTTDGGIFFIKVLWKLLQSAMASSYNVGDRVEVMFPEPGFIGAFFLATILIVFDDGYVFVQFHHLLTYNEFSFLRNVVEVVNIRPLPPFIGTFEYAVHDLVEVFVNDGWWLGRVVDLSGVEGYYEIHFEAYDEVSFNLFYEMRPHLVWEYNRWVGVLE